MSEMLSIKIDVTKILKDRLFRANSGAVYLDATLIPSKESRYGDSHFIVQSLSKEDRLAGKKGPIIGNAKVIERKGAAQPKQEPKPETETKTFMNPPSRATRPAGFHQSGLTCTAKRPS